MPEKTVKTNKSVWILLATIVLAAILRIYDLGAESLWYDEVGSIDQATRNLLVLFSKFHLSPLYFFLLRYWMRIFGVSEFALRFLSVIFGIGSVLLIYKLGEMLFSKKVGLISSLILAVSPFHIFYSQEARHYSLFVFWTLLSMLFFLTILKRKNSGIKLYVYYGIATVLLLYTTLWGIFVVVVQNLFFFLQKITQRKRWIVTQIVIFLIFLIWLIPFFVFLCEQKEYVKACIQWIPRPEFNSLIETFKAFSYGGSRYGGWDFFITPEEIGLSQGLLYVMGIFFILGIIPFKKTERPTAYFAGLWLFVPLMAMFIFSLSYYSVFLVRYLIFALPAYYLLVAKGIERIKKRLYKILIILVIAILTLPSLIVYYTKTLKMDWRGAIDYVESRIEKDEIIIMAPSDRSQMFAYYGKKGVKFQDKTKVKIALVKELGVNMLKGGFSYNNRDNSLLGINNLEQFQEMVSRRKINKEDSFWIIFITRWFKNYKSIQNYCGKNWHRVKTKQFEGIDIQYYVPIIYTN